MAKKYYIIADIEKFTTPEEAKAKIDDRYWAWFKGSHKVMEVEEGIVLPEPTLLESIPDKNQRTIQAIIFVLVILIFIGQMTFFAIYFSLLNYKP